MPTKRPPDATVATHSCDKDKEDDAGGMEADSRGAVSSISSVYISNSTAWVALPSFCTAANRCEFCYWPTVHINAH